MSNEKKNQCNFRVHSTSKFYLPKKMSTSRLNIYLITKDGFEYLKYTDTQKIIAKTVNS